MSVQCIKRVALVTGAAQGIGRAVALRLAADGFQIAVNDVPRNITALQHVVQAICTLQDAEGAALACAADISVEAEVQELISQVVAHFGRLDVMVANAGVLRYSPIVDTTAAEWDEIMAVNARGTFLCYKYAAMQMIKQQSGTAAGRSSGGRIIGAASVCAKKGVALLGAYSASKFAIRGLTQAAALELGKYGITVNAYAPGGIDTDMLGQIASGSAAANTGKGDDEGGRAAYFQALKDRTPLGCLGDPSDVANVVSFLASEESQFITGQSISVNGGTYFD